MTQPAREIPTDPAHTIRKMRVQKKHTPLIRIKEKKRNQEHSPPKSSITIVKIKKKNIRKPYRTLQHRQGTEN